MSIKRSLMRIVYRAKFHIVKRAPELLMATGITAATTGVVVACRATLKIAEVVAERDAKLEKIKDDIIFSHRDSPDAVPYTQEEVTKDEMIVRGQFVVDVVKLYIPPATLFFGGIVCILGAHRILKRRNIALMAAYKAVEEAFAQYRKRVVEDRGVDKDHEYRYGMKKKKKKEKYIDKDGKEKTRETEVNTLDGKSPSMYARIFDETSQYWVKNRGRALVYLRHTQAMWNDTLQLRGHVYLNEVYDTLGFPRTEAGQVVGWCIAPNNSNYIDFGIYEIQNIDFVNGDVDAVLLDFNVDGVILGKVDQGAEADYATGAIGYFA